MALQSISRSVPIHRFLIHCPSINTVIVKRNIFYRNKNFLNLDIYNWVYHDYKFNLQEIMAYKVKRQLQDIKKVQEFNKANVIKLGPNLAIAEVVMKLGGKIKFLDDDIWYRKFEDGTMPMPRCYEEGYYVEGVDASSIILMYDALDYFGNLEHIRFIRFSRSKYVDDWYIEKMLELCPDIEALDLSDCPNITDNGFEMLYGFQKLKVVNITNCHKIRRSEAIYAHLEDFNPELNVIGLNSLPKFESSEDLQEYEMKSSRYLNWGYIMNSRLGLKNDINFDKFFESQMEKVFKESDSEWSGNKEQCDDSTECELDKENEHPDSENESSAGINK